MIQDLRGAQTALNAVFESVGNTDDVPISFNNDAAALQAAQTGVALCDRSHWGRIRVAGADRIRYLHNQSTNDFYNLKPGEGCDTVFVTSTARTLDLTTAYVLDETVLLLVSPARLPKLMAWLDRYIFGADQVELVDWTPESAAFSLIGPQSHALVEQISNVSLQDQPYASHRLLQIADAEVRVAVGNGLGITGYNLFVDVANAAPLWNHLVKAGAVPTGDRVWEQLRIQQGRPAPDHELTEDYNPLEAGLWQTVSFSKGCYIGQETIARLNTYQGVKQQLWGIYLSEPVEPGSTLLLAGDKVGKLTSVTETNQGPFGLAYVRTKAGGAGLKVEVETNTPSPDLVQGELVEVPFLTRAPQ